MNEQGSDAAAADAEVRARLRELGIAVPPGQESGIVAGAQRLKQAASLLKSFEDADFGGSMS